MRGFPSSYEKKGLQAHLQLDKSDELSLHIDSFLVTASKDSGKEPERDMRNIRRLRLIASQPTP